MQSKLGPVLTNNRLTFLDGFDRAVLAEIDFFRTAALLDIRVLGLPEELKALGVQIQPSDYTDLNNIPLIVQRNRLQRDGLVALGGHRKFMNTLSGASSNLHARLQDFMESEPDKSSRFAMTAKQRVHMQLAIRSELGFSVDPPQVAKTQFFEHIIQQAQDQSIEKSRRLGVAMSDWRQDNVGGAAPRGPDDPAQG
ncbi:MAG: hypothetical protein AB8B83_05915 [Bdellovibrionales bacterium]